MFDSCICVDPEEVCALVRRTTRTARKLHRCTECRHTIKPGERYEEDVTVYEDAFSVYKTCIPCRNIRASLFSCGWYYGGVWEDIHEAICGYDDDDELECVCPGPEQLDAAEQKGGTT